MQDAWIEVAECLVVAAAGDAQHVFLRRAVSSAYYALFHRLCRLGADELLSEAADSPAYGAVYRALDHKVARELFKRLSRSEGGDLARIAELFVRLQEFRHDADYSPAPFQQDRAATLDLIEQARQSIGLIDSLDSVARRRLAVQLLVKTR